MPDFRVLQVTDYAARYPGAFIRQLRMLDDELRRRGARPSALAIMPSAAASGWADQLRGEGWQLHGVPPGATHAQRGVADAIASAILEGRPDIVHVHFGTYDLSTRLALRRIDWHAAGFPRPELVWHYRTALEVPVRERGPVRRAKDWIKYSRGGRDVTRSIAVTEALAREVAARGMAANRSCAVVAGNDTETFRADDLARGRVREQLGVSDDETLLLHMGWTWHRKGGDLLVEAMRLLERRGIRGLVAASIGAPDDVDLGPVRRLPLTDRVHEYHQASDIFVSASRSEGFGNGLVEAMACERVAVAASAEGQVETFAGLPGVVPVPVADSVAIADAVQRLLAARGEWPAFGRAHRAHVEQHHSMRRWASDLADVYGVLRPAAFAPAGGAGMQEVA